MGIRIEEQNKSGMNVASYTAETREEAASIILQEKQENETSGYGNEENTFRVFETTEKEINFTFGGLTWLD